MDIIQECPAYVVDNAPSFEALELPCRQQQKDPKGSAEDAHHYFDASICKEVVSAGAMQRTYLLP